MERVGVNELRRNVIAVLRRVEAGEVIEVTYRGRPVARMVPANDHSTHGQLVAENRASLATGDLLDVKPAQQIEGKPLLSEILEDMRRAAEVV
jgi:prevent-host-death family protein